MSGPKVAGQVNMKAGEVGLRALGGSVILALRVVDGAMVATVMSPDGAEAFVKDVLECAKGARAGEVWPSDEQLEALKAAAAMGGAH